MKNIIENKLLEAINIGMTQFEGNSQIEAFEEASREFENLVKKGLVEKRGYNLMTITETHLHTTAFNVKEKV